MAKGGNIKVVKDMLENGWDVEQSSYFTGQTLLGSAAWGGSIPLTTYLLGKGAGVDSESHDGTTPLGVAARNEHFGVAMELLMHGADLCHQSVPYEMLTMLAHMAIFHGIKKAQGRHIRDELINLITNYL